ncbi:MAG: LLM class flavin-dependent oxidoreductase [Chloroflexota bacterium]|nr:LLM class flavin-dependent oxidoreductase [Chloroflexota bacterium]MDE2883975.1 LLM class flavin-dependent oxidoreductase [Chloroflexota bacterium]
MPQRFTGEVNVAVLPPFFAAVEELGYHSCWVVEQAINAQNDLAPIPLLSYAAALTSKARLGSSVLISVLRNPINLAKSLATLDRLSHGRLIAGVGMGNATGAPFSEAFGAPAAGKAARFEEGLVLMQRLWTGERVTFDGRFWQLNDAFISPTPVQERIPLWFGGHAPAALDRAARLGDGWMGAGATSTARFAEEQDAMRARLDAHGRDPATFTTSKRVFIGVEDDAETALRRMQPWFTMHSGSGQRAERVGVYGTPQQCAEGLAAIADTGLGLIALNPLYDHEQQARRLANEVLPLMGLSL